MRNVYRLRNGARLAVATFKNRLGAVEFYTPVKLTQRGFQKSFVCVDCVQQSECCDNILSFPQELLCYKTEKECHDLLKEWENKHATHKTGDKN